VLREFRDFVTRGSVVELAVAVVVALALVSLLRSLVVDVVTPLVGIAGGLDFGGLSFTVRGSEVRVGAFLNELLSFLLTAAAVFFGVVKPLAAYQRRRQAASRRRRCGPAPRACRRCPPRPPAAPSAPRRWPRRERRRPGRCRRGRSLAQPAGSRSAAPRRGAGAAGGVRGSGRQRRPLVARRGPGSRSAGRRRRRRARGPGRPGAAGAPAAAAGRAAAPRAAVPGPGARAAAPRAGSGLDRELVQRREGQDEDASQAASRLLVLLASVARHDAGTRRHSERVRAYVDLLAEALDLPLPDRERLRWGALVHDLGKTEVAPSVLRKPSRLDAKSGSRSGATRPRAPGSRRGSRPSSARGSGPWATTTSATTAPATRAGSSVSRSPSPAGWSRSPTPSR
jgi:large conductance mechanosensitive channel